MSESRDEHEDPHDVPVTLLVDIPEGNRGEVIDLPSGRVERLLAIGAVELA